MTAVTRNKITNETSSNTVVDLTSERLTLQRETESKVLLSMKSHKDLHCYQSLGKLREF